MSDISSICKSNLGRYLSMPLLHSRVNKKTHASVLEMSKAMLFKLPSIFPIPWINSIENFSGEKKKVQLTKWDTTCKPKVNGGLGIIEMSRVYVIQGCSWLENRAK